MIIDSVSYQSGFAPRDGEPLYPSLWRGCVFAAAPCLGPSGLTLRDWSGYGNNGTLTNGPTFEASYGKWSLAFSSSSNQTVGSTLSRGSLSQVSLCGWFRAAVVGTPRISLMVANNVSEFAVQRFSDNVLYFYVGGTGNYVGGPSLTDNGWHHVACIFDGSQSGNTGRAKVYVDGKYSAPSNGGTIPATFTLNTLNIGFEDGSFLRLNGNADDVRIYNRALSLQEICLLASRRGIAYEMAPRRRYSGQVAGFNAYWAQRRRLIIGSGVN